jgi:hypothetical protein
MTRILAVLSLTSAALLLIGAAVLLGDRETVVSPPDAVAEGFMRKVVSRRYPLALDHLTKEAESRVSTERLRGLGERIRMQAGTIYEVTASVEGTKPESAHVTVEIRGRRAAVRVPVELRIEQGVWKVSVVGQFKNAMSRSWSEATGSLAARGP